MTAQRFALLDLRSAPLRGAPSSRPAGHAPAALPAGVDRDARSAPTHVGGAACIASELAR